MDSILKETADYIQANGGQESGLGLILGSGLGAYADRFQDKVVLPYSSLPHFPHSTVSGHRGNLISGLIEGTRCIALQGRVHLYEGYSMRDITFPVRLLRSLGVTRLIVTNAAGGINPEFRPGDLMLITDHINMTGSNPLIGDDSGPSGSRFTDMSEAYDIRMREITWEAARHRNITLRQGVYAGVTGPSYETPAEIRMYRTLGADAIGMSTVAEVIAAVRYGIRVLGISCITNQAAGMSTKRISHNEVLETTDKIKGTFNSLLDQIIKQLAVGSWQ